MFKRCAASLAILCGFVSAQPPQAFEVASIKLSPPSAGGSTYSFAPGGGVQIRGGDVKGILQMAFGVQEFQILGAPGWTKAARYDIVAKSGVDLADAQSNPAAVRQRSLVQLQTLMVDRFRLVFHREQRQTRVYHLKPAKNGPKLTDARDAGPNGGIRGRCGQLTGTNAGMGSLVYQLARDLGTTVDDQTGLSGRYDFQVNYAPEISCQPGSAVSEKSGDGARASVFAALQEQIGLMLEPATAAVEFIVVERIERPAEN